MKFKTFLRKVKRCPDCQDVQKSVVFIKANHDTIGICAKHWGELADSDLEWPETKTVYSQVKIGNRLVPVHLEVKR